MEEVREAAVEMEWPERKMWEVEMEEGMREEMECPVEGEGGRDTESDCGETRPQQMDMQKNV